MQIKNTKWKGDTFFIYILQVRRAEVKVASVLAQHNIPLSFADHLGPLFTEIFPDSEIAKKYRSAKTKTAMILNNALQPFFQQQLVDSMKKYPYCLSIDGSNDTGNQSYFSQVNVLVWYELVIWKSTLLVGCCVIIPHCPGILIGQKELCEFETSFSPNNCRPHCHKKAKGKISAMAGVANTRKTINHNMNTKKNQHW